MVVRDGIGVVGDRADDVAFHNLHVVDVVQQLEAGRRDLIHEVDAPRGAVAHVVLVVDLGVQELHDDRHAELLRQGSEPLQTGGAVLEALGVAHARSVAAEHDHARDVRGFHEWQQPLAFLRESVVVLGAVVPVADRGGAVGDGAGEAVLRGDVPLLLAEQFDGLDADLLGLLAEFFELDTAEAPAAHRLLDTALAGRGGGRRRVCGAGECCGGGE